jgi:hypothetical protein
MNKVSLLAIIGGGALLAAAPFSLGWSPEKNVVLSLDRADARVGRPLTATSVAGVHRRVARRTYRRNVYYGAGAAVAGAATGAYYYGQQYNQPSYYGQQYSWGQPASYGQQYSWGQPASYGQQYSWGQPASYGQQYSWGQPAYYGRPGYGIGARHVRREVRREYRRNY